MTTEPKDKRRVPYPAEKFGQDFNAAVNKLIAGELRLALDQMVAPQNRMKLKHGHTWGYRRDDGSRHEGAFEIVSAEGVISNDRILANDLSVLTGLVRTVAKQMGDRLRTNLYQAVATVADEVGNVVSAKDAGSLADAFLEMLQKVDFGVDSQGRISVPSLHLSPEHAEKMFLEIEARGPEFQAQVERLHSDKGQQALERERERLARYRK